MLNVCFGISKTEKKCKSSPVDLLTVIKHLDQFFHLIPTENNECVMNMYNFPKKNIFPYKKQDLYINNKY